MKKISSKTIPKQCMERLRKEYLQIQKNGHHPNIFCLPLENNLLEWHYVIHDISDKSCPYYGGYYHGKLVFPPEYPYKPPSIYMITENGRFKPNTRLCLSMSDFHPESWNPMWSVSSILTGLLSFMLEDGETHGSIQTTQEEKKRLAILSLDVNKKNQLFCKLFPEIIEEAEKKRKKMMLSKKQTSNASAVQKSAIPMNQNHIFSGILNTILFCLICAFIIWWTL